MRWFAFALEQHSYDEIRGLLAIMERVDFLNFWKYFFDFSLLGEIANHKNVLAMEIAKSSGVKAPPDDRKRIVFALAKHENVGLSELEIALRQELGPNFKLQNHYTFGQVVKSWQEVVKRAAEIRNGYFNLAYLGVENQVAGVMKVYSMSEEKDLEKLKKLSDLATDTLNKSVKYIYYPPSAPELKEIMPKIVEFYKASNRLQLDIEAMDEAADIQDPIDYIVVMKSIYDTKLAMAKKGILLDDFAAAEKEVRRTMSQFYFEENFLSLDEIAREGKALEPITKVARA